eukprot:3629107-Amphidinium_carterae.1
MVGLQIVGVRLSNGNEGVSCPVAVHFVRLECNTTDQWSACVLPARPLGTSNGSVRAKVGIVLTSAPLKGHFRAATCMKLSLAVWVGEAIWLAQWYPCCNVTTVLRVNSFEREDE